MFDSFDDPLDRLAEFEIRRIEQALMPLRIKHTLRREQFDDGDLSH
jgi:hypothetical protein